MDHLQREQTAECTGCMDNAGVCGGNGDAARIRDVLTGSLIGLARATEGNEYMVSDSTAAVVVEGLYATLSDGNYDSDALPAIRERVDMEKRKLVPECYNCASPCGRTSDYDMNRLCSAGEDVRSLKLRLLSGIRGIAAHAYHAAALGCRDNAIHNFLYKALFAIGMDDWGVEELQPILLEAGEVNRRCGAMLDRANAGAFGHPSIP